MAAGDQVRIQHGVESTVAAAREQLASNRADRRHDGREPFERAARRSAVYGSVCTGAFAVGSAGLLVDAARRMLEGSDRPLKTVAYDCGFARLTACASYSAIASG